MIKTMNVVDPLFVEEITVHIRFFGDLLIVARQAGEPGIASTLLQTVPNKFVSIQVIAKPILLLDKTVDERVDCVSPQL